MKAKTLGAIAFMACCAFSNLNANTCFKEDLTLYNATTDDACVVQEKPVVVREHVERKIPVYVKEHIYEKPIIYRQQIIKEVPRYIERVVEKQPIVIEVEREAATLAPIVIPAPAPVIIQVPVPVIVPTPVQVAPPVRRCVETRASGFSEYEELVIPPSPLVEVQRPIPAPALEIVPPAYVEQGGDEVVNENNESGMLPPPDIAPSTEDYSFTPPPPEIFPTVHPSQAPIIVKQCIPSRRHCKPRWDFPRHHRKFICGGDRSIDRHFSWLRKMRHREDFRSGIQCEKPSDRSYTHRRGLRPVRGYRPDESDLAGNPMYFPPNTPMLGVSCR